MHVTPEDLPEDHLLQQSCFPTSKKRRKESHHYASVNIFNREEPAAETPRDFTSSDRLVRAAWAILLRSYTHEETISFAVLSSFEYEHHFKSHTNGVSDGAATEVWVLQYMIPDSCRLKDIHETARWRCKKAALKGTQISTAINSSAIPFSKRPLPNGELPNLICPQKDTFLDGFDIILNFNAACPLANVFISYRSPTVSNRYAHAVANTFRNISKKVALNSECKVGQLDFVSQEDKQSIMSWNPEVPYAQMNCMHYLVEATARLDNLASIAAARLAQAGVRPGVYVPFAYEKSLWTVVATLAILKAGGAFVPLEPTHPKARLKEILSSINASIIVTSDLFASSFQDVVKRVLVISARTVSEHHNCEAAGSIPVTVKPSDSVFVLFTSGSTGQPKGMIHEHGAICTHAITHGEAMGYHGARVLQFAAHTFDVAIIDIYTTLIFGGVVCIPSEEDRRSNIVGVINSMKADYALLTPSFAGLIEPSEAPTLKTLAIGGEALPQDRLQRWAEKVSLIQVYGPAEVGICMIMHMRPRETLPETVGYPLRNSLCWLVDPDDPHRLVPIGAIGELVVAGPSLARGYINNEAKTQSCFLDTLAWADRLGLKCGRFYKTGDLLRYNTDNFDGSYDFVGRKDAQIKLRGQRIEPAEVEHHITGIPEVAISMVTRPELGCFAGELVAVVQMRNTESSRVRDEPVSIAHDQSLSIESIKSRLSKALPGYMIPTVCIMIKSMPFVPSLKINRKLIENWLNKMQSRPPEVAIATLADLKGSPLDPGEVTANVLSVKIAELVASKDTAKRVMLEGHDFLLQKAGIDSIQIISLSMFLLRRYSLKIPMGTLLGSKLTIRYLAYLVDHHNQLSTDTEALATVDVNNEAEFLTEHLFRDVERQPEAEDADTQMSNPTQNVFVTGASGYLGSAILQRLLNIPDIHVFALVRCSSESTGLQRIRDAAIKTGWWRDHHSSRIHVWKGDLTEPNLGLEPEHLQYLRGTTSQGNHRIHAIIHNGARVRYSSDYETLKPSNVHPTLELLKITAYAESLSTFVFVSGGQKPSLARDQAKTSSSMAVQLGQANGYTQTKLVSEQIVRNCTAHASFQATRLCIIKPGYIVGSLHAGIANRSDFIWRLIAGCIEIGAYNRDETAHWLFIADVERVARAVVSGVFDAQNHASGHVEQVLDGLWFSELWELLRDDFGYELQPLGYEEWMGRLQEAIMRKEEEHLLFPLLHVLEREGGMIGSEEGPGFESKGMMEVIRRNVRHLIEVGFLPRPPK